MEGMIGEIRLFAPNFAPRAWELCAGQLLAISSHTALFAILGNTYGGDGRTTFALPKFNGRSAVSSGQGPGTSDYRLGQKKGTEDVTLTLSELPAHTHYVSATNPSGTIAMGGFNDEGSSPSPVNNYPALVDGFNLYANAPNERMQPSPVNIGGSVVAASTGNGQPHENMQPFLVLNYIICMQGVFPSRG